MARTTIQIDYETLVRLRKLRGSMEAKTGEETTYDDVLNLLIDKETKKRK